MKIGIAASARSVTQTEVTEVLEFLKAWKFEWIFSPTLFCVSHQFAGTDDERAFGLQTLMDDPELDAIWFVRGGYGSVRILDKLNWSKYKEYPKRFIGFSDLTILLNAAWKIAKCPGLHAPLLMTIKNSDAVSQQRLQSALRDFKIDTITTKTDQYNQHGKASGVLIGGNLSVLYSMWDTPYMPELNNCILILEDLDEYLYHIDRILYAMKISGKLNLISGLIVGGMTDMHDNNTPFGENAYEIIRKHFAPLTIPIAFSFPSGHVKNNYTLEIGGQYQLEVSNSYTALSPLKVKTPSS